MSDQQSFSTTAYDEEQLKRRFQTELEFVQALANPYYINCAFIFAVSLFHFIFAVLAQRDYFKEPTFVNYLKYLLYWKRPEYAVYVIISVFVFH
jgi:mediator of RNA polymerase II transcription subunit 31